MCQATCGGNISRDKSRLQPVDVEALAECSSLDQLDLPLLQQQLESSHQIASARIVAVEQSSIEGGLASPLIKILAMAIDEWTASLKEDKKYTYVKDDGTIPVCSGSHNDDHILNQSYLIANTKQTDQLKEVLSLHLNICQRDVTLCEELARGGSHLILSKIVRMDIYSILSELDLDSEKDDQRYIYEMEEDAIVEIQDMACEVAHSGTASAASSSSSSSSPTIRYPVKMFPYTNEELKSRLPLVFDVTSPRGRQECLMVRQVTDRQSAQEDVGFVMWPSAVVLASWLLDQDEAYLRSKSQILEIGAGCGLTGLVAARMVQKIVLENGDMNTKEGSDDGTLDTYNSSSSEEGSGDEMKQHPQVILSDFNHKVLMNADGNIDLNGLGQVCRTMQLDFYRQDGSSYDSGWIGQSLNQRESEEENAYTTQRQPPVDLILAADVICKPSDSVAASNTIYDALVPGGEAIVVSADAAHRFGVDIFERECHRNGLEVKTTNVADMCNGKLFPSAQDDEDPCGIRQTSGFVEGMTLTMFRVKKPVR